MRGFNAAQVTYNNLDLKAILGEDKPKVNTSGLLAPRKQMGNDDSKKINQPAYRAAKHVELLRKQRENLNGSRST